MNIEKLRCVIQHYDWGRVGSNSEVAKLSKCASDQVVIDEGKPYAELWMGVHPNGPSKLASTGELLSKSIVQSTALGAHEHGTLQFLFKVLSVNKALSIQSHPDKAKAKILHTRDPAHYPDDNHKPEMAIALTDFKLLCGFRQSHELLTNINATPEFLTLLSDKTMPEMMEKVEDCDEKRGILKRIFSDYMRSAEVKVKEAVGRLTQRLTEKETRTELDELMLQLGVDYPGDIGVFAPLLLNYFTLKKGESVFLGPNSPHAYLSGDCVECMACSDNTVRAGLTPKFKDVDTLCSDLTFEMSSPPYFSPRKIDAGTSEYAPPVGEFAVHQIQGSASKLRDLNGSSSIVLVVKGSAQLLTSTHTLSVARGDALFIPASDRSVAIQNACDFVAYRAFTPAP